MLFNPSRKREVYLQQDAAWLRSRLTQAYDLNAPMGNIAASRLGDAISAWLVALSAEIAPVIPEALQWLDGAIAADETFGQSRDFHRVTLHWARALGKWMASATNATDDWAQAANYKQAYWLSESPPLSDAAIVRYDLDDYMAYCVQAGRYSDGIEMCDRLFGGQKLSLGKRPKPREVAYAVCQQKLFDRYDDDAVFEAGRRMLQANLEQDWLGAGQYIRAATWLKIVYWDRDIHAGRRPTLTPLQTVLKAYDNMPQVVRPDFIQ